MTTPKTLEELKINLKSQYRYVVWPDADKDLHTTRDADLAGLGFDAGFDACLEEAVKMVALEIPEVKALKDELINCLNYIHWNADDLTGDDLVGDGKRTLSFNNRIKEIEQALAQFKKFRGES